MQRRIIVVGCPIGHGLLALCGRLMSESSVLVSCNTVLVDQARERLSGQVNGRCAHVNSNINTNVPEVIFYCASGMLRSPKHREHMLRWAKNAHTITFGFSGSVTLAEDALVRNFMKRVVELDNQ